jgi:hypothetical protein
MTREYGHGVFIQGCGSEGTANLHKIRIKGGCDHLPAYLDAGVGFGWLVGQVGYSLLAVATLSDRRAVPVASSATERRSP